MKNFILFSSMYKSFCKFLNYICCSNKEKIEEEDYDNYITINTEEDNYNLYNNIIGSGKKCFPTEKCSVYIYNNNIYKVFIPSNISKYENIIEELYKINTNNLLTPEKIYNEPYIEKYKYYKNGDLFSYIMFNNHSNISSNSRVLYLFERIVNCIHILHSNNIVHRDIKPDNFLITYNKNKLDVILIDFEFASKYNDDDYFSGGSYSYAAPEIFKHNIIDNYKCIDIWSLGIVLFILIQHEFPWNCAIIKDDLFCEYLDNINNYWKNKIKRNDKLSQLFYDILAYCFKLDYTNRNDITYIIDLINNYKLKI